MNFSSAMKKILKYYRLFISSRFFAVYLFSTLVIIKLLETVRVKKEFYKTFSNASRCKMKAITSKYFSMVEVALAIGILAIGAATVITLVTVGINQSRDSIGQNYSAIFADDTYSYFASQAKLDWNSIFGSGGLPAYNSVFPITTENGRLITSTNNLTKITGTDLFSTALPGIYAIVKSTTSRPTGEQDYAAQVVVWQSVSDLKFKLPTIPEPTALTAPIVSGSIGISPTSSDYSFELTTTDGSIFNKQTMQDSKKSSVYEKEGGQTFSVSNFSFQTKATDNTTINVNGEDISVKGKAVSFTSAANDPLIVRVWKETGGMGQWYLQISSGSATVTIDGVALDLASIGSGSSGSSGSGVSSTSTSNGVGVNVEISWPLSQTNYDKRSKLRYYFEVYNINNIGV